MVALKAKTLAETLIAMIIITLVMAFWSQTYLKIAATATIRQQVCAQNLMLQAKASYAAGTVHVEKCGVLWQVSQTLYRENVRLIEVRQLNHQPPIVLRTYAAL